MLDHSSLLFRFKAIADAGSLRRAADTLHITQPALTRSLKQLETHYGKPLVERHARGVRPTVFGQKLMATISRLARDWDLAEMELMSEGSAINGVLRVSTGPLWTAVALPVIATRLQRLYPNLSLEIGYLSGDAAMTALFEGRLDVIFGGLQTVDRTHSGIVAHQFTSVRDRVIARHDHPIHDRRPDDYDALHDYPWIIYASDAVYEAETIHAVVERTSMQPNIRIRSASLFAAIRLLQEGDYLCILPDAFAAGISGKALKPTPIELGRRISKSGALYRKSIANYEPLRALIDLSTGYFDDVKKASAGHA